jgi:hypothetical protein
MKVFGRKLVIACFIISILVALIGIAALIPRIVYGTTGINLNYFLPGCTSNIYYTNIKFGFTYISLKIQLGANIAAILAGALSFVLLLQPVKSAWADRNIADDLDANFKM